MVCRCSVCVVCGRKAAGVVWWWQERGRKVAGGGGKGAVCVKVEEREGRVGCAKQSESLSQNLSLPERKEERGKRGSVRGKGRV